MSELRALAASVVLPGFHGTTVPDWLHRELEQGLAGVCLFGQNVATPDQVRQLGDALHAVRPGVLVASDEEGGTVTRLEVHGGSRWPSHVALGALDDPEATYAVAAGIGARARAAGVDLVLAPDADVTSEPDNPVIGVRSFGGTADLVGRHASVFVRGLQDHGVAACVKHFPGHGATRTDSHLALPVLDVDPQTLRARDLPPFAAAVAAGTRCVMTAHVVVPGLDTEPATMSPVLLRLLREELGFEGVVVSDGLDMKAISSGVGRAAGGVRALAAGVDLLCLGNPAYPTVDDDEHVAVEAVDAVVGAVRSGVLAESRLVEASHRVADLAAWCAQAPRPVPLSDDEALATGTGLAARSLQVRGDVALAGDAAVVTVCAPFDYAAGVHESSLVAALRRARPDWTHLQVGNPDDVVAVTDAAAGKELLVLVEKRMTAPLRASLDALLARWPRAVVVYRGLPDPSDPGTRTVHTQGGGRASAEAAADLLLEGQRR